MAHDLHTRRGAIVARLMLRLILRCDEEAMSA